MVYTLHFFFSSKCSLFHNSNVFGSCIIHIFIDTAVQMKGIPHYNLGWGRGYPKTNRSFSQSLNKCLDNNPLTPNDP